MADGGRGQILDEARTITVSRTKHGYLIALDIDLHASVCPITFGDTKEGSMGVRVPDSFRTSLANGGTVTAADGTAAKPGAKDNLPVWGQLSGWNDYSGKVGDTAAGIAVFADAKNPHPSAWHTRAYGLMAANPFGREKSGYPVAEGEDGPGEAGQGRPPEAAVRHLHAHRRRHVRRGGRGVQGVQRREVTAHSAASGRPPNDSRSTTQQW